MLGRLEQWRRTFVDRDHELPAQKQGQIRDRESIAVREREKFQRDEKIVLTLRQLGALAGLPAVFDMQSVDAVRCSQVVEFSLGRICNIVPFHKACSCKSAAERSALEGHDTLFHRGGTSSAGFRCEVLRWAILRRG
jgi:hypothetical protein